MRLKKNLETYKKKKKKSGLFGEKTNSRAEEGIYTNDLEQLVVPEYGSEQKIYKLTLIGECHRDTGLKV